MTVLVRFQLIFLDNKKTFCMSRSFALQASSNSIVLALSGTWIDYMNCFLECWFWCSGQRFFIVVHNLWKIWHGWNRFSIHPALRLRFASHIFWCILYLCIFFLCLCICTKSSAVLKFTFATCKAQLAVWVENYSCGPELHLKFSLRSRALIIFLRAQNF